MIRPPTRTTLFPYTTLFRSQNNSINKAYYGIYAQAASTGVNDNLVISSNSIGSATAADYVTFRGMLVRSEEHTSELQSRLHLVCRLLLEKKNARSGSQTCRY